MVVVLNISCSKDQTSGKIGLTRNEELCIIKIDLIALQSGVYIYADSAYFMLV